MAKNHRGKLLRSMPNHGRGECPFCHRTGVKLTQEVKAGDKTIKVCKICKSVKPEAASA